MTQEETNRPYNMQQDRIKFAVDNDTKKVYVSGFPQLEGREGRYVGDGMAMFWGKEWGNQELFIANTKTCKIRKLSTKDGTMLVNDNEIDLESIAKECPHGYDNAKSKYIGYASVNRYDDFENGICAISWMIYPEGRYFEDSDGFGGKDNDEETVYAIMDTNLDIIVPFRPVKNITVYLKELRSEKL